MDGKNQHKSELPSPFPEEKKLPALAPEAILPAHASSDPAHAGGVAVSGIAPVPGRRMTDEDIKDMVENRQHAAVSYLYLLSFIVLFAKRKSKFARFHASQGIVICILSLIFLLTPSFINIPVQLLLFAAIIIGSFQAANGFYYKLPIIYNLVLGKLPELEVPHSFIGLRELYRGVRKHMREQKLEQPEKSATIPSNPSQPDLTEARQREGAK